MLSARLPGVLLALACAPASTSQDVQAYPPLPRGLNPFEVPAENPMTPEKVALGKTLFFDPRLAKTGMMSCKTCHVPEMGWTDGRSLSPKFDGTLNTRHTPTLLNVAYYTEFYWDGRAPSLEAQILAAWKVQMGADPDAVAKALAEIPGYKKAFQEAMGGPPTGDSIVKALACFVRTILSGDSPWDRYEKRDKTAVSPEVVEGFRVFTEVAYCALCHQPPLYTDTLFHNVGVGFDKESPDLGRGKFLADAAAKAGKAAPADAETSKGAFKTPTLRAITETGPYFHDGRAATLEEAVDFMLKAGIPNPNLDPKLKPYPISETERKALLAFLRSLTPEKKPFERPTLPQPAGH